MLAPGLPVQSSSKLAKGTKYTVGILSQSAEFALGTLDVLFFFSSSLYFPAAPDTRSRQYIR